MSTKFFYGVFLLCALGFAPFAQAQQESQPLAVDAGVTYSTERAKIAASDCGCFWLQGGSLDGSVRLYHGLGIAAILTGGHSGDIAPGVDLNKVAFMAGPRYTWTNRWLHSRRGTRVFGEALFGGAHAFDSAFPSSTGLKSSASAFSMQIGGGVDLRLAGGLGLRAIEVDYVRTSLPNGTTNTQNDLRLAFGISYHFIR